MGLPYAVAIGAGIGGMCAARMLSEHFERVPLVERDELSGTPMHRKGVPQSRHPHVLLDRNDRIDRRLTTRTLRLIRRPQLSTEEN
jgi:glycine/D-amino acid oxidase-like deaminating enzyme